MRVNIGEVRLFVEIVGKKLRAEDGMLAEKPSVVFIHGGPAFDHRTLLSDYEPLQDVAQLVFYDHRGLGRSDHCSSESWNLQSWAADLYNLILTLGLDRPIVFGQSFGGAVAQQFAVDYPDAYSGLVLSSTSVRIDPDEVIGACRDVGGEELARIAIAHYSGARPPHKFLLDSMKFFTKDSRDIGDIPGFRTEVFDHFYSVGGEGHHFDIRADLHRVKVPVLVVGGDRDPMIPRKQQEMLAAALDPSYVQLVIMDDCGHGPARDQPERMLDLMRTFIAHAYAHGGRRAAMTGALEAPPAV